MANTSSVCRFFSKVGVSHCSAAAKWLIEKPVELLIVLVVAMVVSRVVARLTRKFITSLGTHTALQRQSARAPRRAYALASSAAGVSRVIVWIIALPTLLSILDVNLGPFVAVTTVVGAALGFGAQSLVKDLLSGFMILAEDQYAIGDRISLPTKDMIGIVEDVNLMRTRMRADDGNVWFIANGEIREVANLSLDWVRATVDIVLPYGADLDAALITAANEAQTMSREPEWATIMKSAPETYAQAMDHESVTMRVTARTPPGTSSGVSRTLLQRILSRLHSAGPMLVHTQLSTNPEGSVVISAVPQTPPSTPPPDTDLPPVADETDALEATAAAGSGAADAGAGDAGAGDAGAGGGDAGSRAPRGPDETGGAKGPEIR
ncbi:MAG: mechanosensitive ion channel family protein [Actinomycetota bacterium]